MLKEIWASLVDSGKNILSFAKSKKSIVATLVFAVILVKQMSVAQTICLTLIALSWIAAQTIVDIKGKKE